MASPFLSHLIAVLSVYELSPPAVPVPRYEGPRDWQTDAVERGLASVARRMCVAEERVGAVSAGAGAGGRVGGDGPVDSGSVEYALDGGGRAEAGAGVGGVKPTLISPGPPASPLVVPPGPLAAAAAFESGMSPVEELRLLKAQVSDVARVCKAVADGDLAQKVTVPVHGVVMVQLKDIVNTMVDNLGQFARRVTSVGHDTGCEGTLGGEALVPDANGTWRELTDIVNELAGNSTNLVRSIAAVTSAVARGDFSKTLEFDAHGEVLDLRAIVNAMVLQLRTFTAEVTRVARAVARGDLTQKVEVEVEGEMAVLKDAVNGAVGQLSRVASEVTRVVLEVGTEGILDARAVVADAEGSWADLTRNVNHMATGLMDQVRSFAGVTQALAQGDLTKTVDVDVRGDMLGLKTTVNHMVKQLATLVQEVTRVSLEVGTEGVLGGQVAVAHVGGSWKVLSDTINALAMALTNQVRSVASVTYAVTQGDFSKRIEGDVRGDILQLKETVNGMTEGLSAFADEITRVAREVGKEGQLRAPAAVPKMGGAWKVLIDDVNIMATNVSGIPGDT